MRREGKRLRRLRCQCRLWRELRERERGRKEGGRGSLVVYRGVGKWRRGGFGEGGLVGDGGGSAGGGGGAIAGAFFGRGRKE